MAAESNVSQKNSLEHSQAYIKLQRKRKRKIMKLRLEIAFFSLIALVIVLILLILNSAGVFYKRAETNTFILNSDKSVTFEEVEKNDTLTSKKELSKYINGIVDDYNSENGNSVKVKQISLKDNTAYVRLWYKDYQTYADFTGHDVFLGTVKSALKSGYDFDTSFYPVKDGKFSDAVSPDGITSSTKSNVLIVGEAVNIRIDGKRIKYVSSSGTSYVADDEISVENTGDAEPVVYIVYSKK